MVGSTLYFSIVGGGSRNPVAGVAGNSDDADIYSWSVGDTSCAKLEDGVSDLGLPGNADIDGLTVVAAGVYRISFADATSVPGLGTVQDESVVTYDNGTWSMFFSGSGQLDGANSQDVDALHAP